MGQLLAKQCGWKAEIVVTPPSWRMRTARWLFAFSVLLVVFQAYALLAVPWIEPSLAGVGSELPSDSRLPAEPIRNWQSCFPRELGTRSAHGADHAVGQAALQGVPSVG